VNGMRRSELLIEDDLGVMRASCIVPGLVSKLSGWGNCRPSTITMEYMREH